MIAGRLAARRRAQGFTLIEVLVALTIAAVALMAALRATGSLANTSDELRMRTLAQWSAENRISLYRIVGELPPVGRNSFECSQAGIAMTCEEEVFAMPSPLFRRVEVQVYASQTRRRLARMIGFAVRSG
jgi:general secretion pathway protein I